MIMKMIGQWVRSLKPAVSADFKEFPVVYRDISIKPRKLQ
jgi:hypothetical protein